MEAKAALMPGSGRRIRMAGDLLWFASASLAAGLLAAIAVAAIVMLLAQPIYASDPQEPTGNGPAATSR